MPTIRPFVSPETLRTLAPARWLALLEPHRDFLSQRGVAIDCGPEDSMTYEALAATLADGSYDVPCDLLTSVSVVDELATEAGMDALLSAAKRKGVQLELCSDDTPADVAVMCWLHARSVAESVHAEHAFRRQRSFVSFQTDCKPPRLRLPGTESLHALEQELGAWFEARRRGRGCRVLAFDRPDGWWFLVRHGGPMRREESWEGGRMCYRSVQYDILAYDPHAGELRINTRTKGERELYRCMFGQHLFGTTDFFPGCEKYTLAPLINEGPGALDPAGVPGLDRVLLGAVQIFWGGAKQGVECYRAHDVFAYLSERGTELPTDRHWTMATFKLKFSGVARPLGVTIRPSNLASYARNESSDTIERWLQNSGFMLPGAGDDHASDERLLASA